MVALGDGRTRKMYEFLAPIVGFDYKVCEYKSFEKALAKIKSEIDAGYPCMIGALDMFYLPHFEKLYHKEHIPFHYELAIGYDDEAQILYFLDCGRRNCGLHLIVPIPDYPNQTLYGLFVCRQIRANMR